MATSGLMIIAKTEFAYHRLQKEFLNHRVQKKYIAIISEKDISEKEIPEKGIISLPLQPDYLNRPRQIVNHEQARRPLRSMKFWSASTAPTSVSPLSQDGQNPPAARALCPSGGFECSHPGRSALRQREGCPTASTCRGDNLRTSPDG